MSEFDEHLPGEDSYVSEARWATMSVIDRERAIAEHHKKRITNPVLGLGQWDHFVRWWDAKGSHREAFRSRSLAEARADELRPLLATS